MKTVYVAGTHDTKAEALTFVLHRIRELGVPARLVDLSTSSPGADHSGVDVSAREVAAHHPEGVEAVFTGDRGQSGGAMALAFERYVQTLSDLGGLIGLGGSGGTALVTPAMRALPVGTPKLMVSTMASGNVAPYVGPTDLTMMYSVTDVAGLNRVSRQVFGNAASAIAGMVRDRLPASTTDRPTVGLSMFGVTTPCVQMIERGLEGEYDAMVFHATGTGGMSMEKLLDSGLLSGLIDITTTEVADLLFGGVLACTPDRFGAVIRTRRPYVGSCGALDMVNFGALDTVPEQYRDRTLYVHNAQVTLMRTTPEENAQLGAWIAARLNQCEGEVRFLIPEGGLSLLDVPGMPFSDPEADAALFSALERDLQPGPHRHLIRVPHAINDPAFAAVALAQYREIMQESP